MNNTAKHKVKLNKQTCKSARCDEGREWTVHWDADIAGFGLRVMASGVKSYIVDYRAPGRRRRQVTLGRFPALDPDDARRLAKKELYSVAAGEDPAERRRREKEGERFEDVSARYLDDLRQRAESGALKGRLSGWTSQESLLRLHVPPAMKRRRVQDITVQDVQALHKALAAKPATADKVVGAVGTVLERALGEGLVQVNVARAVKAFNKPGRRRRAVTTDELAALGAVLRAVEETGTVTVREKVKRKGKEVEADVERDVDPAAARAIRVLALTGMRRSELVGHPDKKHRGPREGLRWADVDLDAGTYHLEAHGGGSGAKGGKPRDLPLGKAAVEYLRSFRPAEADDDPELPVIPSPRQGKRYRHSPLVGFDKPRKRIYAAAGIKGADVDAHSLRHTFESVAFEVAPAFAGALTGRAAVKDPVLNSYIHPDADRLREVADAVAERIARALDGEQADVLEFKAAEPSPAHN